MKKLFSGQSLFEVLFAIAMVAIILTGVVSLGTASVRNTSFSSNQGLAARYARETIDWLRQERDGDWNNIASRVTLDPWCITDINAGWPGSSGSCDSTNNISGASNLFREVTLTFAGDNEIAAEIAVEWTDSQGLHQEILNTVFVNWQEAAGVPIN